MGGWGTEGALHKGQAILSHQIHRRLQSIAAAEDIEEQWEKSSCDRAILFHTCSGRCASLFHPGVSREESVALLDLRIRIKKREREHLPTVVGMRAQIIKGMLITHVHVHAHTQYTFTHSKQILLFLELPPPHSKKVTDPSIS